jgi:branched-chain amino acid transport system permease protein
VPDIATVDDVAAPAPLSASSRPLLRVAIAALVAAAVTVVGPFVLDTYTVNILVRAFFVAIAALTVDVL